MDGLRSRPLRLDYRDFLRRRQEDSNGPGRTQEKLGAD